MLNFWKKFTLLFLLCFSFNNFSQGQSKATPAPVTNSDQSKTSFYQDPTEVNRNSDPYMSLLLRVIGVLIFFLTVSFIVFKIIKNRQNKISVDGGPIKLI